MKDLTVSHSLSHIRDLLGGALVRIAEGGAVEIRNGRIAAGDLTPKELQTLAETNGVGWFRVPDDAAIRQSIGGNPWSKSAFNLTKQLQVADQHPDLAELMKREAA